MKVARQTTGAAPTLSFHCWEDAREPTNATDVLPNDWTSGIGPDT